jgi:hypothetical protein
MMAAAMALERAEKKMVTFIAAMLKKKADRRRAQTKT